MYMRRGIQFIVAFGAVVAVGAAWLWTIGCGRPSLVRLLSGGPVVVHSAVWRSARGSIDISSSNDCAVLTTTLRFAQRDAISEAPQSIIDTLSLKCSFGTFRTIEVAVYVTNDGSLLISVPGNPFQELFSRTDHEIWVIPGQAASPILRQICQLIRTP